MYSTCRLLCATGLFVALILVGGPGASVDCFVDCRTETCWTSILDNHYKVQDDKYPNCNAFFRDVNDINTVPAGSSFAVQLHRYFDATHACDPTPNHEAVSTNCDDPLPIFPHKTCYEGCQMGGTP